MTAKSDNVKIWIVMGTHGDYSDRTEWPVRAFTTKSGATRLMDRCLGDHGRIDFDNALGDGRELWEVLLDLSLATSYDDTPAAVRRKRAKLRKLGVDIPSDPVMRPEYMEHASWYVMGPIVIDDLYNVGE